MTKDKDLVTKTNDGYVVALFANVKNNNDIEDIVEGISILENKMNQKKKIHHIKLGIIVEIPSVALNSYELAKECDFFFIETNSLTKYTFGAKEKKHDLYTKFQPSVIKLVQQAIEGAHDAGIFCGICGEVVENELYIPLLIGLGIDEFSINSKNITKTRTIISELDKSDCKDLAEEVFQLRTLEDIDNKLKQFMQSQFNRASFCIRKKEKISERNKSTNK